MIKTTISKIKHRLGALYRSSPVYWFTLNICSKNGVLSDLWYLLSGAFRREHQAVLFGRAQHRQGMKEGRDSGALYTLRRNTHRLEKGLIMRPCRDVFALDYIFETVKLYECLTDNSDPTDSCIETLTWSRDVLRSYFEHVDNSNPQILKAISVFETTDHCPSCSDTVRHPYKRELDKPIDISIDELYRLAYRRRSCRWFLQEPVPRDLIDKAIEIGALAPSACNRQPFQFRIFDNPEDAKRIGEIPGGTVGFVHNFPCLVVVVGDLSAFPIERDRHIPYIDASLAAMGFQFALEVQGLSSCCINWPDVEAREKTIAAAMGLQPSERVVMLIAIGFPDPEGMVPFSQKKPLSEIRSYDAN